ncbi:hypothetical protein SARC_10686 [Sphaeroforma arctica JP610]|uniref:Uncharacterized protein n=1 Tax=Sphaeroforma arctica JP610 TaxID=667725 RepID=A0A0L0FJ77_9EUKA|nr:hypothetical protein SARC_10686 [Sphaeroforma arctica JP610]KNC76837.1 hypothetical protein SARC_10686 [Sphaeroforma arctica JP610]|eukprot:XP_014150739.1 hypothetical protein SARC_10686 [Sphaeroforma arctica JP610]
MWDKLMERSRSHMLGLPAVSKVLYLCLVLCSLLNTVSASVRTFSNAASEAGPDEFHNLQGYNYGRDTIAEQYKHALRNKKVRIGGSFSESHIWSSTAQGRSGGNHDISQSSASAVVSASLATTSTDPSPAPAPEPLLSCRAAHDMPYVASNRTARCQAIRTACSGTSSMVNYTALIGMLLTIY